MLRCHIKGGTVLLVALETQGCLPKLLNQIIDTKANPRVPRTFLSLLALVYGEKLHRPKRPPKLQIVLSILHKPQPLLEFMKAKIPLLGLHQYRIHPQVSHLEAVVLTFEAWKTTYDGFSSWILLVLQVQQCNWP